MFRPRFQKRQMPDAVKRLVLDGGLPAVLGLAFFELDHFVHDELPVAGGNLRVAGRQIGAGDLQVHGRLLLRFACGNGTTARPSRGRWCRGFPVCRSRHRECSSVRRFSGDRVCIVVS